MVRSRAPRSSLALWPAQESRPLSRLAFRNHAAADDGEGRRSVLRTICGAMANGRGAGRCAAGRGPAIVGGARLLLTCAQSESLCRCSRARFWRRIPENRDRASRTAGHRPLHGGRYRGHRIRRKGNTRRRQRRARRGSAFRRSPTAAGLRKPKSADSQLR